jgi:hypothetical protein
MGDVGDYWNDHRDWRRSVEGKQHHERRRAQAIYDLERIPEVKIVEKKNFGMHFILRVMTDRGECTVDFWPDTLKWKKRKSRAEGEGVRGMVAYFKIGNKKPQAIE